MKVRLLLWCMTAGLLALYGFSLSRPALLVSSTVSDGKVYLATAQWILDGRPAGFHSANAALPIGYPLLIATCQCLAIGLVQLNLACLAIGLAASWFVLRQSFGLPGTLTWAVLALFAATDLCRELSVTVASECAFFAASMTTVAMLERRTFGWTLAAIPVCLAAILIRTAGVALIPALLWACISHPGVKPFADRRSLAIVSITVVSLSAFVLWKTEYVSQIAASRYNAGTDWGVIAFQQLQKFSALGEIATNQRAEEYRGAYRPEFAFFGGIVLSAVFAGFWSRFRQLRPADIYTACYGVTVIAYPFFFYGASRRFLFPIVPLLAALGFCAIARLYRAMRSTEGVS
jgi:hypothetical protein